MVNHVQLALQQLYLDLGKAIERRGRCVQARTGGGSDSVDTMGVSVIELNENVQRLAESIGGVASGASAAARGGSLV